MPFKSQNKLFLFLRIL